MIGSVCERERERKREGEREREKEKERQRQRKKEIGRAVEKLFFNNKEEIEVRQKKKD